VISHDIHQTDAAFLQFRQLCEEAVISFRDDAPVLKPVVEEIADDIHLFRITLDEIKKVDEAAFLLPVLFRRSYAEMGVGEKVGPVASARAVLVLLPLFLRLLLLLLLLGLLPLGLLLCPLLTLLLLALLLVRTSGFALALGRLLLIPLLLLLFGLLLFLLHGGRSFSIVRHGDLS
jgi:hypothetical protein